MPGNLFSNHNKFSYSGQISVKTSMYKDGHVFVLHILDPKDLSSEAELDELLKEPDQEKPEEPVEKAETESPEKGSSARWLNLFEATATFIFVWIVFC